MGSGKGASGVWGSFARIRYQELINDIDNARKEAGFTLWELSLSCERSRNTFWRVTKGVCQLSYHMLFASCKTLNLGVFLVFHEKGKYTATHVTSYAQIAIRMRARRKLLNFRQLAICAELGVHRQAVHTWEHNLNQPPLCGMIAWVLALGGNIVVAPNGKEHPGTVAEKD